ncbi:MAG: bifunctional DNA-formamidopyrimidine glycosylase/DNA-(apurinic or apyrimidinic site) lyase [Bryobacterales bacterium]|nr:bifunctional DNA-formamidopyrimidine glycosylase/DNA-(apurinic or apyrimidinic site) lyase [Bryobacterales bacterium]
MPELPEVEAVVRRLREQVVGARITAVEAHRCAAAGVARRAVGRSIAGVERRGKHILVNLSDGWTLHVHLRMTGHLHAIPDWRLSAPSARVVIALHEGSGIVYEDPRAFGRLEMRLTSELRAELESTLGVEPLCPEFTPDRLLALARASRQPVKTFLLDQRRLAGLGNIYAAEALFAAGIDPRRQACRLAAPRLTRLHQEIVRVLHDAVESARIAYGPPGGFSEGETFNCQVYDREGQPCFTCGKKIRRLRQAGRSTYLCTSCQR